MDSTPFISICIPAYKRTDYLKQLLNSVASQSFRDFEVVVSDDSGDDSVEQLILQYQDTFPITYQKNPVALGSPENWNACIRRARGKWIKMMHDDDWFSKPQSLQEFAAAASKQKEVHFIFSGFTEVDLERQKSTTYVISNFSLYLLRKSPLILFRKNVIGHPSTTLIRNIGSSAYDGRFKWVVDIEYYIRFLSARRRMFAIQKPLINIGINEFQITKEAFRNPAIEIPEVLQLYYVLPPGSVKNIFVYDYYWRFVRNLSIRSEQDINRYAPHICIPHIIQRMIQEQAKWPLNFLKKGLVSKSLMLASYIRNYQRL